SSTAIPPSALKALVQLAPTVAIGGVDLQVFVGREPLPVGGSEPSRNPLAGVSDADLKSLYDEATRRFNEVQHDPRAAWMRDDEPSSAPVPSVMASTTADILNRWATQNGVRPDGTWDVALSYAETQALRQRRHDNTPPAPAPAGPANDAQSFVD